MQFSIILLVALCCLNTASAEKNFRRFFGKFAAMKMFSHCFGEEYMNKWTNNFTISVRFCNQQASENYLRDLPLDEVPASFQLPASFDQASYTPGDINEENLFNYLPPGYPSVSPVYQNVPQGFENIAQSFGAIPQGYENIAQGFGAIPQGGASGYSPFSSAGLSANSFPVGTGIYDPETLMAALQGNLTNPILLVPLPYNLLQGISQQGYYRQKREIPTVDAETINNVYQKIRNKAANFTCIMKTLHFFDDNFDVDVGYQMSLIANLNIDSDLKAEVFQSMTDCIRFASCKPLDRKTLMPPAVQRAMEFMKCESQMNLASCVKFDLLKEQHEKFDHEALEKIPAGSDVDLGDKMLAILWGQYAKKH